MMRAQVIRVVVGSALVVAPLIGATGLSVPAGAASSATCNAVVGTLTGKHAALSGCTAAATGGTGVLALDAAGTGDIVKWANGGTTKFKFKLAGVNASAKSCASGHSLDHLQAHVLKSTGAASAITGNVSAYLCLPSSGKGNVTLEPGTLWRF